MLQTGPYKQPGRDTRISARHTDPKSANSTFNHFLWIILFLFSTGSAKAQIAISADLFGQNAWWIDNNDTPYPDQLDALFDDVAASGVKYVRIGGIEANFNPLYSWNSSTYAVTSSDVAKLTGLIDEIRSHGMEPIIQVGHNPTCSGKDLYGISLANQALIAANVVDRLNNDLYSGDPIMYWIIANEPDLATNCANSGGGFGWSDYATETDDIANMMKEYSTKMKNADPDIQVIGPELAMFGADKFYDVNKIMNDLISAPSNANSIMGTISTGNGSGRYFVDVISFHTYPSPSSRANVIRQVHKVNGYASKIINDGSTSNQWRGIVEMIENNSTNRSVSNLKIACTEFNLEHVSSPTDETSSGNHSAVLQGYDNRSFLAGQWMTEVFLASMALNSSNTPWMKFMNPWSIKEGDCDDGFGYINSCSAWEDEKRPSYWHYSLLAEHFGGSTFYPVTPESGNADSLVKAYVCVKGGNVKVLVLNQKTNSTQSSSSNTSISIRFDNNAPTGGGTYKFRTTATVPSLSFTEKTISSIENEGTWLYEYNTSGTLVKQCVYKLYGTGALVYDCDEFGGCTPPSAPTAGSNSPVCAGSTIYLTANTISGATYSWTGPNGFTSASEDPNIPNCTTAAAGTYSVTATVAGCTSSAGTVTVTVNTGPTASASSNSPVCESHTIELYANTVSGATYSWTGPASFSSSSEDPTRTGATEGMGGTYTLVITAANGCTSQSTTTVTVPQFAAISPSGTQTICSGSSVTLSSVNTNAGYAYQWKRDGSNISGATNSTYPASVAGEYQLKITKDGGTCPDWSAPVTVNVNSTPSTPTAGSNSPVCQSATINLTCNAVSGATYSWTGPNGYTSSQEDPSRSGATTSMAGTYSVTVTVNGCTSATGTTTVVIPAFASIGAGSSTTFCPESSVTLYASDGVGYTYQWIKDGSNITGAILDEYTATSSGDYQVKITRASDGCTAWSSPTTVDETSTHVARITPAGPTTFCSGGSVRLHANTCSGHTYQWQKKDGSGVYQPISGATSDYYDATTAGWYQVRVTKSGNNQWSSGIEVVVNSCRLANEEEGTNASASQPALAIAPNPTPGEFTISLSGMDESDKLIRIEVMNALGQVVHGESSVPAKGSAVQTAVRLDAKLAEGTYVLRVIIGEKVLYSKFVLSR